MNAGPVHFRLAVGFLEEASGLTAADDQQEAASLVATAQVYATLALVAATVDAARGVGGMSTDDAIAWGKAMR